MRFFAPPIYDPIKILAKEGDAFFYMLLFPNVYLPKPVKPVNPENPVIL
jgi:hypothetical protein